ncbi:hypothetical protein Tco_0485605 [Tanacetum coccineum]
MSTPVFVDPKISTKADGAQSSRVPVPLPKDPYETIRRAYLVGMDTKSKPFEDHMETEAPESPHTVSSPTSLPDSTPPTLAPILYRTTRMVVRVPPAMSLGLSANIAEVKCYRGTSELVEDDEKEEDDEEGDDEEEDEEIEESLDSNSMSEDAGDEGPTAEDEDPAIGDEGLAAGDEDPGIGVESLSLGGDAAVPEGQQRAAPVMETTVGEPLRLGYEVLRRREIALGEGRMPSVFEVGQSSRSVPESERPKRVSALRKPSLTTWIDLEDDIAYIDVPAYPPPTPPAQIPPSPEWSSGSLPVSPVPSIVPLPISSPMIPLTVPSLVASPATAETEGFLTELGARVEMQRGLIHDHTRPVLALESWAGQTDTQRAAMWHAISDTQMENRELQVQIAEERRAWLDLAEIVDSMKRGQEPRGDV